MNKLLVSGSLVLLVLLAGVVQRNQLQQRIRELEQMPQVDPTAVSVLDARMEQLHEELERTRALVTDVETARRIEALEGRLGQTGVALAKHGRRLRDWESLWSGRGPDDMEQQLVEMRDVLEQRWRELDEIADGDRERIAALDESLDVLTTERDTARMWSDLVGPVVQIAGDVTVGSGVLLESRPSESEGAWTTYLITSWHVVRDIYGSPDNTDRPVDIKIYIGDGTTVMEQAVTLAYDVPLDVALLRLETDAPVENGARLAPRERAESIRIFDPVYAVGCPLGNDPIPTAGEVAAIEHLVDGETYWMISAPTYIGNSGGGIFDADSHELLGIFSKIYTHGTMRSTIVPHMGLVTPLEKIYDWLEGTGYAEVAHYADGAATVASAPR